MEGFGELLFGGLQLLLGFLELGDVAHYDNQRGGGIEVERLGGNQASEQLAIVAAKRHL
ncbi:hypothetical protein D3C72_716950 [compost metagenome]